MSQLFLTILNMSISAGWIVLAVIAVRLLLKKAPKWITVLLWAIVALRLVLPFTIESQVSMQPSAETVSPQILTEPAPQINSGIPIINQTINPIIQESAVTVSPEQSVNGLQLLILVFSKIWVVGVLLMLLYTAFSFWRISQKMRTAVWLRDNIFQSEQVVSPFVLGLVSPKVYLPFCLTEADMSHVVAHEQAHIRRKDHWWKPLGFLLLAIHWFNPLLWLGYVLLCRDIELACDESVVKDMDIQEKADYSQALLRSSVSRHMIAACPLAFGEVGVKNRIKAVLNYKKPAFWIILVAILASITLAVCFLTDPVTEPEQPPATDEIPTPEGTAITWQYMPMASYTGHNFFYFDFDFEYEQIKTKCNSGVMWKPDVDGQPTGTTMDYSYGQSVCWSPYETVMENVPYRAQVILDIYHEDGTVGYCKVEFTCTDRTDSGYAVYEVRLTVADEYRMISHNNGGLICRLVPLADLTVSQPPVLVVVNNDRSMVIEKETYSWTYMQESGTLVNATGNPQMQLNELPVLELIPSYTSFSDPLSALISFNATDISQLYTVTPSNVTARCWAKDQWYATDPKSEDLSVHTENGNWYFTLKDGEYIYEVVGTWNTPTYSGSVTYRFRTTSPYMTRYPVIDASSKVKQYYFTTPTHQLQEAYSKEELVITQPHAQLEDGLWVWESYGYLYRLEVSGRMHASEKNSTYIILSNTKDITFDQAWKAAGYSSLSTDYFSPETAVIVGHRVYD